MDPHEKPEIYIEEAPRLPPSIDEVDSALPAFIGYTERARRSREGDVLFVPTLISSVRDFEAQFGNSVAAEITIHVRTAEAAFELDSIDGPGEYYPLYDALRLFYENGGRQCYVVSVGARPRKSLGPFVPDVALLSKGVDAIAEITGPTMVVVPEAVDMSRSDYAAVATRILTQCANLQDRFAIFDLYDGANAKVDFKAARGAFDSTLRLAYGAVYFPHLVTSFAHPYLETAAKDKSTRSNVAVSIDGNDPVDLSSLDKKQAALRAFALASLRSSFLTLPPSAAIAGVYAANDRNRGVWKAPANVALDGVMAPAVPVDSRTAERIGVDSFAGKSINTIRDVIGRGTLVWGARTLAGNDNEWRYVSVRRFITVVEQSVRVSTQWVVFEPNDATTWVRVRASIENYLTGKWRDGALVGTTTDEAFFVHCGLGTTMTQQDILEGRLIVEIGMAVVRPAEFVVIRFMHRVSTE